MTRTSSFSIALVAAVCAVVAYTQPKGTSAKSIGMEFVKVAPGEFTMGCSEGDAYCTNEEKPAHRVQLTKAFEMGKFEVTQAQWQAVTGSNPATIKGADHPVETIAKDQIGQFLDALNAAGDGYKYRLPTEAEWEYAALAGGPAVKAASLGDYAWFNDNSEDETHPVGQKRPNAWGLYDMLGNVREWVADAYAQYPSGDAVVVDPFVQGVPGGPGGRGKGKGPGGFGKGGFGKGFGKGPGFGPPPGGPPPDVAQQQGPPPDGPPPDFAGKGKGFKGKDGKGKGGPGRLPVMRGGAWDNNGNFVRASARYHYYGTDLKVSDIGFRVAREPVKQEGQ